ncbi:hypothetical protein EDD86DRAFT_205540 [Gorgonomyces haynaldii]|nr:hypothetical protein EDD86DRAFT_205540 [Gorgonomyces haynaldii]
MMFSNREKLMKLKKGSILALVAHVCCILASITKLVVIALQNDSPVAVRVVNSWTTMIGYMASAEYWLTLYSAFSLCSAKALARIQIGLFVILVGSFGGKFADFISTDSFVTKWGTFAAVGIVVVTIVGIIVCFSIVRKLIQHAKLLKQANDNESDESRYLRCKILAVLFLLMNALTIGSYMISGFLKLAENGDAMANNVVGISAGANGLALVVFVKLLNELVALLQLSNARTSSTGKSKRMSTTQPSAASKASRADRE